MKFVRYIAIEVRGAKVDWDASEDLEVTVRQALLESYTNDASRCRIGTLRRPFVYEPPDLGRRSKRHEKWTKDRAVHPKGAVFVASPADDWFLVELPE